MRRNVLVVDDDPANRLLARAVLAPDYEVVEAASGPEALEALAREPIALVLLDVMMPEMSGIEACPLIKAAAGEAFLPVILLTALAEQSDRNAGLEAGADDFLTKPFDRRELQLRVATFLRLRDQDEQIRAQIAQLRELDSLKDDLVSLVVHDLRNPLAACMAVLDLADLGGGSLSPADRASLRSLHDRMRHLLDDMLVVRQLEEGARAADRRPGPLAQPLRLAAATCEGLALSRGVVVDIRVAGDPVLALDAPLVQRAMENLISNAVKHAPRGTRVDVEAAVAGEAAVIRVGDRGPGIPPPVRARLFEKFGTVGSRAAGGPPGFGLGLYLVRLVASLHAGHVLAVDRHGGGTWFLLTLPGAPA